VDTAEVAAPAETPLATEPRIPGYRHFIAWLLGAGIPYALLIYNGSSYSGEWSATEVSPQGLFYDSVASVLIGCGWILLVLRFVSGEQISSLNLQAGRLWTDLQLGISALFSNIILTSMVSTFVMNLAGYYSTAAAADMSGMVKSGGLMLAATICYDWLAAATFEELLRAFCISRILKLGDLSSVRICAVAVSTVLFGLYHLYYGPYDAVIVSVMGLVFGITYVLRGRVLPLIIAHGLTNTWITLTDIYWTTPPTS
jgi:membrane protease YdiL (CAAX protease family)